MTRPDEMADLHAGNPVMFVAVATGQAAANLPPILEMACPDDRVLWLESQSARRGGWAQGPRAVLAERQVPSFDPVSVADEPAAIVDAVRQALVERSGYRPVFVYNGGTKLTSLALDRVLRDSSPPILYGLERPAELWFFPAGNRWPTCETGVCTCEVDARRCPSLLRACHPESFAGQG